MILQELEFQTHLQWVCHDNGPDFRQERPIFSQDICHFQVNLAIFNVMLYIRARISESTGAIGFKFISHKTVP